MKEPIWVLPEIVASLHQMLLAEHGGSPGVRDQGLLDSALSRPRQRFSYSEDHSIFDLAAAYAYGLAGNHPFIDGNKRVALTVAAVFLEMNGYALDASEAEAVVIFEQLASGSLSEEDLSRWFMNSSISNE
jgi:death-on-curing protein